MYTCFQSFTIKNTEMLNLVHASLHMCAGWSVKWISHIEDAGLKSKSIHNFDITILSSIRVVPVCTPTSNVCMCTSFPTYCHFKPQNLHVGDVIRNMFLFANSESFKKKSQMFCLIYFFIKPPIDDKTFRITILEWTLFFLLLLKNVKELTQFSWTTNFFGSCSFCHIQI